MPDAPSPPRKSKWNTCIGEGVCVCVGRERLNRQIKSRILKEYPLFACSFIIRVNFYSLCLHRNDDFVCWMASSWMPQFSFSPVCVCTYIIRSKLLILPGHRTHCTHLFVYIGWFILFDPFRLLSSHEFYSLLMSIDVFIANVIIIFYAHFSSLALYLSVSLTHSPPFTFASHFCRLFTATVFIICH